jgi:hypothetical protein
LLASKSKENYFSAKKIVRVCKVRQIVQQKRKFDSPFESTQNGSAKFNGGQKYTNMRLAILWTKIQNSTDWSVLFGAIVVRISFVSVKKIAIIRIHSSMNFNHFVYEFISISGFQSQIFDSINDDLSNLNSG